MEKVHVDPMLAHQYKCIGKLQPEYKCKVNMDNKDRLYLKDECTLKVNFIAGLLTNAYHCIQMHKFIRMPVSVMIFKC